MLVIASRHPWRDQPRVAPPVVLSHGTLRYVPNVPPPGAWSAGSLGQSATGFSMPACDLSGSGFRASLHRPAATTLVGPVTGLVQRKAFAYSTPAVSIHLVGKGPVNAMAQAAEAAL
jgi:hypothetical protein